jgi:phenylalanyl-tRNA synthetase beta chain
MVGLGLDEALPTPFLAPDDLQRAGLGDRGVSITNPLVAEESVLRTSLRPGLLRTLAYNRSHRVSRVALFELGTVFLPPVGDDVLPREPEHLGVIIADRDATAAVDVWSVLVDSLAVEQARIEQARVDGLHPTRSGDLVVSGETVGAIGEIDPAVLDAFGVDVRVAWLELDIDHLLSLPHGRRDYALVSRYPSSDIDLAFEVDESIAAADVADRITDAAADALADLHLFDVFRGAPVPEGKRSLAFTLRLQAPDRTLTDADVAEVRERVIRSVESSLPARLRA